MILEPRTCAFHHELIEHLQRQECLNDRRLEPRYDVHGPVSLGATADDVGGAYAPAELRSGWALDISRQGMSWLMAQEMAVGARYFIDLRAVAGNDLVLPVQVGYCKLLLPGMYRVGGRFLIEESAEHPAVG